MKKYNVCNWSVRMVGKRESDPEAVFKEIMTENFPKLFKDIKPQTQKHYKYQVYIESHT